MEVMNIEILFKHIFKVHFDYCYSNILQSYAIKNKLNQRNKDQERLTSLIYKNYFYFAAKSIQP